MDRKRSAVHLLPDEVLLRVLIHCPFLTKVAAGQACRKWRELLLSRQANASKIWGLVKLDWDVLATRLMYGKKQQHVALHHQLVEIKLVLPLCRWLAARAPGISLLSLEVHCSRPHHEVLESATASSISTLLAVLADIKLDMSLNLRGHAGHATIFTQPCIVNEMARHIVGLSSWLRVPNIADAVEGICHLHRLTRLEMLDFGGSTPILTAAISQLTALQELRVANAGDSMSVPPEISSLQALTRVSLRGFECSHIFCDLPKLRELELHQHYDCDEGESSARGLVMHIPSDLSGLSGVASLALANMVLGPDLRGLGCLSNLRSLQLTHFNLGPGSSAAALGCALGRLTLLSSLHVAQSPLNVAMSALHSLKNLKSLTIAHTSMSAASCSNFWQSLTLLDLRGNDLTCMPSHLTVLSNLAHLDVSYQNEGYMRLPPEGEFQIGESLLPLIRASPRLHRLRLSQHPSGRGWSGSSLFFLAQLAEAVKHLPDVLSA